MFGQYFMACWMLVNGIMVLCGEGWSVQFAKVGIRRVAAGIYFAFAALMAVMSWVEHDHLMDQRTYIIVYAISAGVLIVALFVLRLRYGHWKDG